VPVGDTDPPRCSFAGVLGQAHNARKAATALR
jgi:hypothetical protein